MSWDELDFFLVMTVAQDNVPTFPKIGLFQDPAKQNGNITVDLGSAYFLAAKNNRLKS